MVPDSALLDHLKGVLRAGPPLRLAILFGSAAAGALRPESDVDIGIIPMDADLPLAEELDLQAALARVTGRSVDLVRIDVAPTLVKWQVARHGVPLLSGGPRDHARFVADSASESFDFEPALKIAQARFLRRLQERGARGMRDRDLVARKLSSLQEQVARMRRRRGDDASAFAQDVDRQDALAMSRLVALQDALDIVLHVASDEGWGVPASYAAGFELLRDRGVIDASLNRPPGSWIMAASSCTRRRSVAGRGAEGGPPRPRRGNRAGLPHVFRHDGEARRTTRRCENVAVDLATRLGRMASLRNRIAHGYATVDAARILQELPAGLDALEEYAAAIAAHVSAP